MLAEDDELYLPLLRKFRTPLISGKKKTKWDKYKDMYHMLSKFKGCCAVLISVRGLIAQTTFSNKVTADYINFYFWGMTVKTRKDLRDMDQEDDLICLRMSTSYYECTVTVGGVFEESDFMILVTQNTPQSLKRPIYNLKKLVVQGTPPCDFPVQTEDPVPAMRKAIIEMTERTQDSNFSPYERKKIAFLSAAERGAMSFATSEKASTMSLSVDASKRTILVSQSFTGGREEQSFTTKTTSKSRVSQISSYSGSMVSYSSGEGTKSGTKYSVAGDSKSGSRQVASQREKKYQLLRKEKFDWIKIDKDDQMTPPELAPLYERTTSEESSDDDDDIGYWRKLPDKTFSIFGADGTVIQDEVTIGFKPCSGEQFPPRKWTNKKARKEMVFKRRQTPLSEQIDRKTE
uniref:Dynein light chain roadblock-type 2 n=1 Tax=Lygus hesperus TaxID=30085 RepID=A0A0A9WD49_LYGHE